MRVYEVSRALAETCGYGLISGKKEGATTGKGRGAVSYRIVMLLVYSSGLGLLNGPAKLVGVHCSFESGIALLQSRDNDAPRCLGLWPERL